MSRFSLKPLESPPSNIRVRPCLGDTQEGVVVFTHLARIFRCDVVASVCLCVGSENCELLLVRVVALCRRRRCAGVRGRVRCEGGIARRSLGRVGRIVVKRGKGEGAGGDEWLRRVGPSTSGFLHHFRDWKRRRRSVGHVFCHNKISRLTVSSALVVLRGRSKAALHKGRQPSLRLNQSEGTLPRTSLKGQLVASTLHHQRTRFLECFAGREPS